jgi:hypothetical protein
LGEDGESGEGRAKTVGDVVKNILALEVDGGSSQTLRKRRQDWESSEGGSETVGGRDKDVLALLDRCRKSGDHEDGECGRGS